MGPPNNCAVDLAGTDGAGQIKELELEREGKNNPNDLLPQFRNRRAFLVWCVSCGFVKPERLTERIVAEIRAEAEP